GFPSFPSLYLLAASMSALATVPQAALQAHAQHLSSRLVDGLAAHGHTLLTPLDPTHRGTNISIVAPDGAATAERLLQAGVRAWGGDGRVRFSVHGFTTAEEVDQALAVLGPGDRVQP